MFNDFCFHNVGHGLFYSGSLSDGDFNFVYDCGSKSKYHLKKSIINYTKSLTKNYIDFICISHLHSDHYNGLMDLLKYKSCKEILLPFISDKILIVSFFVAYSVFTTNQTVDNQEGTKIYNKMLSIYKENELFAKKYNNGFFEKRIKTSLFENDYWTFKFFNKTITSVEETKLENELNKIFKRYSVSSVTELINKRGISSLSTIYNKIFGSHNLQNLISTILIHYPINYDSFLMEDYYYPPFIENNFKITFLSGDVMFTNDIALKIKANIHSNHFIIFQIPHHGSYTNYCSFISQFPLTHYKIDCFVSSTSFKSSMFPDPRVLSLLKTHKHQNCNEFFSFSYNIII